PASPHPPVHAQRSAPESPRSMHTSNASSVPSAVLRSSAGTGWSCTRFHAHSAAARGTRYDAAWPIAHASIQARPAPTGPHAFGACQNVASSGGRWNVATLAADSNANAPSSTERICRRRLTEREDEDEGTGRCGPATPDPWVEWPRTAVPWRADGRGERARLPPSPAGRAAVGRPPPAGAKEQRRHG